MHELSYSAGVTQSARDLITTAPPVDPADVELISRLMDPGLRRLSKATIGLSGEAQQYLVVFAERLHLAEGTLPGTTAEM